MAVLQSMARLVLHQLAELSLPAHCRGLTLTELLVASTLLTIATAGGLTAFSRAHAARGDAGQLQQLHERAQYVFATLEPELQMAGFFDGDSLPPPLSAADIPESAQHCGSELLQRIDLPVQAHAAWTLPCEARGDGAKAGSHVLVIRRASARTAGAPQAGRAQWQSLAQQGSDGKVFWRGDAPPEATAGTPLRELIVRAYYVASAADGNPPTPALRVKSLTSIGGVPAFIDTEVMPGVERMQIVLLPSPAAPRAVQVQLRIRTDAATTRAPSAPQTVDVSRRFWLRNAGR